MPDLKQLATWAIVLSLGGTVQAGPRLSGGFRLRVQLPMDPSHPLPG